MLCTGWTYMEVPLIKSFSDWTLEHPNRLQHRTLPEEHHEESACPLLYLSSEGGCYQVNKRYKLRQGDKLEGGYK